MLSRRLGGFLAAALCAVGARAEVQAAQACRSDLVVDNFSKFYDAVNSLGDATSDDQSMASIGANNGILSFVPKDTNSYYYESFPCVKTKTEGYGGLQFTITYPAGSAFTLEIQTKSNCNNAQYTSEWFTIAGLTGTQQVVTLDLNVFGGSNLDAIVGFVWAGFTVTGTYTFSDIKFVCGRLDTFNQEPSSPNPRRPQTTQVGGEPPRATPAPLPSVAANPQSPIYDVPIVTPFPVPGYEPETESEPEPPVPQEPLEPPEQLPAPAETPAAPQEPETQQIPAPEETPAPVEIPAPVEQPAPEETPAPVESPTPNEPPAPPEPAQPPSSPLVPHTTFRASRSSAVRASSATAASPPSAAQASTTLGAPPPPPPPPPPPASSTSSASPAPVPSTSSRPVSLAPTSPSVALSPSSSPTPVEVPAPPTSSLPTQTLPTLTLSTETLPTGSLPIGTLPTSSLPIGTLPTSSLPIGSLPTGSLPIGTLPTASLPIGTLPTASLPIGTLPTGNLPTFPFSTAPLPISGWTAVSTIASSARPASSAAASSVSPPAVISVSVVPRPPISSVSVVSVATSPARTFSTSVRPPIGDGFLTMSLFPRDELAVGATTTRTTRRTSVRTITTTRSQPTQNSGGSCRNLLIDDWSSQSRLTFLFYNALLYPTSDDATMRSVVVHNDNTMTLTPEDEYSYFYSQFPCIDASNYYGGISLRLKANSGTAISIQIASVRSCGGTSKTTQTLTARQLGWSFDGSMRSYNIPFDQFDQVDTSKLYMIFITGLSRAVTFGPMAFYCGDNPSEWPAPAHTVNAQSQYTVSTPSGNAGTLLIDRFDSNSKNALGQYHGCEEDCVTSRFGSGQVTLQTNDSDLSWYTAFADRCADITAYRNSYLHISYSGSNKFTLALQQGNPTCDSKLKPWPETWDSIEVSRYSTATDIYVPMSHFNINLGRVTNLVFKGFYTTESTVLKRVELVNSVPSGWRMPNKLPSGNLVFSCKRPNSFAFAIDDGDPALAQEVMEIVRSENIKVTFFTVGLPLEDKSNNLSSVYKDMQARGHQIALHSYTHPKMEGLADYAAIDWEYNNDINAVARTFGNMHTPYFRPPFGTEGARMRQRLAVALNVTDPYLVMWSVDVEDWLWGTSKTPEKQLEAFKRDLAKGGNLVVCHYLYPNTVKYLRQFIRLAKETGKQLMRVDQCMNDPRAPPLSGNSNSGQQQQPSQNRPPSQPPNDTPINRPGQGGNNGGRGGGNNGGGRGDDEGDEEDPGWTDWDD